MPNSPRTVEEMIDQLYYHPSPGVTITINRAVAALKREDNFDQKMLLSECLCRIRQKVIEHSHAGSQTQERKECAVLELLSMMNSRDQGVTSHGIIEDTLQYLDQLAGISN